MYFNFKKLRNPRILGNTDREMMVKVIALTQNDDVRYDLDNVTFKKSKISDFQGQSFR